MEYVSVCIRNKAYMYMYVVEYISIVNVNLDESRYFGDEKCECRFCSIITFKSV